jgi:hypothetical protein
MRKTILFLLFPFIALADDVELAEKISKFQTGARDLSDKQDELAADVQQLTIEQTVPKVIELFREVEDAMDEASERLYEHQTDGVTIAAETDVIEKIFEAAKEKQKQSGQGQQGQKPGSAMLDMMERMMGREPGQKPGDKPGDKAGQGSTGDSNSENTNQGGASDGKVEQRRVPKGSGTAGKTIPREFQDALKAYNRGAEKLTR